jgi:hypothetical protein
MDAHLFRTDDILITPSLARFGPVSYQVATISSVAVYHRPRFSPIAVTLVLGSIGLGIFAYAGYAGYAAWSDYSLWAAVAAPVALILGAIWQKVRPVLEYRLVLKTAANETETMATFDRSQAFAVKDAIETAFVRLHQRRESIVDVRGEPQSQLDSPTDEEFYITRDWLVANPSIAPR